MLSYAIGNTYLSIAAVVVRLVLNQCVVWHFYRIFAALGLTSLVENGVKQQYLNAV